MEEYTSGKIQIIKIINSFFSSNTYIIRDIEDNSVWLIDCGDANKIIDIIDTLKLNLKGVFFTHIHYDHIYGLNELRLKYGEFIVYTNDNGKLNLYNSKFNFSKFHDSEFVYEGTNIRIINGGETLNLTKNVNIDIIATPGHDWSSMTYRINDFLFTGDSYIPNIKTVTNFPKSNKIEAKQSEEIIMRLFNENTIICPGHGPISKLKE